MVSVNARACFWSWSRKRAGCRGKSMAPRPHATSQDMRRTGTSPARARVSIYMPICRTGLGSRPRGPAAAAVAPAPPESVSIHGRFFPVGLAVDGTVGRWPQCAALYTQRPLSSASKALGPISRQTCPHRHRRFIFPEIVLLTPNRPFPITRPSTTRCRRRKRRKGGASLALFTT